MGTETEKVSKVIAIKRFFELDGGRKVGLDEFKQLTPEDREELGAPCAAALGLELKPERT